MDTVDTATRSRIMRAIKSKDTKPELQLAAALRRAKVKELCWWSRSRAYKLPGSPDFVFATARLAVFVHGCYWHLCPKHYKAPAGEAWRAKMERNRRRDIRVRRQLRRLGWRTMVVWEHTDADRAAARIKRHLQVEAVRERLSPVVRGIVRRGVITFPVNHGE